MYPRIEFSSQDEGSAADCGDAGLAACVGTVVDGRFFSSILNTTFYILRHGQSEGNATMTFQGRMDYPLDAKGLEQAHAAAAWLAGKSVDAIVASPLLRASKTASIIATACGLGDPLLLPSLVEVDVGIFSGIDMPTARAKNPEVFSEFHHRSWDAVPEAETSDSMYARAVASWIHMRKMAENGARTIVCVSHGGLIQWLIRSTFGARSWLPLLPCSNCGISRFDVETFAPGSPAFVQWSMINFMAPAVEAGAKPLF